MKRIQALCNPAMFYLVVSGLCFLFILFQNLNNPNEYCVGTMKCNTESKAAVFIGKVIYILFWTWIIDLMCKGGYTNVAWFLLFLPLILFFVLLAVFILMSLGAMAENTLTSKNEPEPNREYLL
tara:strand:+ start:108 stop:479 length:372 start_codon:yes stop_codon:yes gene_type:complete